MRLFARVTSLMASNHMRLAVLSDIHGNLPALEAVLDDMNNYEVDQVVIAGDSINWAPFSVQVMQRIMAENWAVIRGNHEYYFLEWGTSDVPEYRRNWTIPRWLNRIIPTDIQIYIGSLPDTRVLRFRGLPSIRVCHGVPGDHWRGIYPETSDSELKTILKGVEQETVIVGHTHLSMNRHFARWHIFNPGSVGVPLNGIQGASYLLLESDGGPWIPTFRHVTYDMQPIFDEFERLDYIQLHGPTGRLSIEELRIARPLVVGFNRWLQDHYLHQTESVALAEAFLDDPVAKWEYLHPFYRLNLPDYAHEVQNKYNAS